MRQTLDVCFVSSPGSWRFMCTGTNASRTNAFAAASLLWAQPQATSKCRSPRWLFSRQAICIYHDDLMATKPRQASVCLSSSSGVNINVHECIGKCTCMVASAVSSSCSMAAVLCCSTACRPPTPPATPSPFCSWPLCCLLWCWYTCAATGHTS